MTTYIGASLFCMPAIAAADWAPRPAIFTYDATFAICTSDPTAPDLALRCADELTAAYVLKRAVAQAAYACGNTALADCPAPFEDEGLPAIAVRIAVDVGCDANDVSTLTNGTIPRDHCIAVASDIMLDEGVVPIDTNISCGNEWSECDDLAVIHTQLWEDAVFGMMGDDPLILDLLDRTAQECAAETQGTTFSASYTDGLGCIAGGTASIWADIAQQTGQDN